MPKSRTGAGNIQGEHEQQVRKSLKDKGWGYFNDTQELTGKTPNGQSCHNLRNKINNIILDYNPIIIPKYETNTKEFILI